MTHDQAALVYATAPNEAVAAELAEHLLENELIACANILPGMTSVYRWQGRVETARECAVIFKTTKAAAASVVAAIERSHPYDTPAALVVDVADGSNAFLRWIEDEVAGNANGP